MLSRTHSRHDNSELTKADAVAPLILGVLVIALAVLIFNGSAYIPENGPAFVLMAIGAATGVLGLASVAFSFWVMDLAQRSRRGTR